MITLDLSEASDCVRNVYFVQEQKLTIGGPEFAVSSCKPFLRPNRVFMRYSSVQRRKAAPTKSEEASHRMFHLSHLLYGK